jgi:hypothetical protein
MISFVIRDRRDAACFLVLLGDRVLDLGNIIATLQMQPVAFRQVHKVVLDKDDSPVVLYSSYCDVLPSEDHDENLTILQWKGPRVTAKGLFRRHWNAQSFGNLCRYVLVRCRLSCRHPCGTGSLT